jgi:hypothetical protein
VIREPKSALELEKLLANFLGFDQDVIVIEKHGSDGNFRAIVTGRTAWLSEAAAQTEADKAGAKLNLTYRLRD